VLKPILLGSHTCHFFDEPTWEDPAVRQIVLEGQEVLPPERCIPQNEKTDAFQLPQGRHVLDRHARQGNGDGLMGARLLRTRMIAWQGRNTPGNSAHCFPAVARRRREQSPGFALTRPWGECHDGESRFIVSLGAHTPRLAT
jgi:hypothetical protein